MVAGSSVPFGRMATTSALGVRVGVVGDDEVVAGAVRRGLRRRGRGGRRLGLGAVELGRVQPVRPPARAGRAQRVQRQEAGLGVAPVARPVQPGRLVVGHDLERRLDLRALAVGLVEPGAGEVRAGAEVVRVRAAGDEDQRRVALLGGRGPRAALGRLVLGVDGELRALVGAEPQLHQLPVALVLAAGEDRADQLVVVVVVEQPVLEPQAALAVDAGVAVDAIAVARVAVADGRGVLGVGAGGVADQVVGEDLRRRPCTCADRDSRGSASAAWRASPRCRGAACWSASR